MCSWGRGWGGAAPGRERHDCKKLDTTEQLTPVVRTLHSHCEGPAVIPGQRTRGSQKPHGVVQKRYFLENIKTQIG